jgi:putative FmdB family regulatory protein
MGLAMPTYEYACEACGHAWEAEQSIKDAALTDCPSCGAPKAKRQISKGAGFILKGGGWTPSTTSTPSSESARVADTTTSASEAAFHERFAKISSNKPGGD